MKTRYSISFTEVGRTVHIGGIEYGVATLKAKSDSSGSLHLVVHFNGYSYNPGSPHSGMRSYAPAETVVYRLMNDGWFERLIAY